MRDIPPDEIVGTTENALGPASKNVVYITCARLGNLTLTLDSDPSVEYNDARRRVKTLAMLRDLTSTWEPLAPEAAALAKSMTPADFAAYRAATLDEGSGLPYVVARHPRFAPLFVPRPMADLTAFLKEYFPLASFTLCLYRFVEQNYATVDEATGIVTLRRPPDA
jgi:hypothetical protein